MGHLAADYISQEAPRLRPPCARGQAAARAARGGLGGQDGRRGGDVPAVEDPQDHHAGKGTAAPGGPSLAVGSSGGASGPQGGGAGRGGRFAVPVLGS